MPSVVPQGSVPGPLLFLLYINDIAADIASPFRMLADDCAVYRVIKNECDRERLQHDLDRVMEWCTKWKMPLNVEKCVDVTFTRKRSYRVGTYRINSGALSKVTEYKYLGVLLMSDLRWAKHVNYIKTKAARVLGFLRRHFSQFSQA